MDYYILLDGVKQGPFDIITMIKKVKNGSLNLSSMVSEKAEGPFREARHLEEVANMIDEHSNPSTSTADAAKTRMTLKASFHEGLELWIRRILDYTIIAAVIIALGLGAESMLKTVFTNGNMIPSYIAAVVIMTLFFEFCYYVLETKRSQKADLGELLLVLKRTILPFFVLSLVLSLFVLVFGISAPIGFLASFGATVVLTFLIFTPFIATDSKISVLTAAKLSIRRVKSLGGDNFGVLLAIISINLFAAIVPILLGQHLLGIGLFISLPVTISALAYIYDQIFV